MFALSLSSTCVRKQWVDDSFWILQQTSRNESTRKKYIKTLIIVKTWITKQYIYIILGLDSFLSANAFVSLGVFYFLFFWRVMFSISFIFEPEKRYIELGQESRGVDGTDSSGLTPNIHDCEQQFRCFFIVFLYRFLWAH